MGYFSNGTEGEAYQVEYCDRCANQEVGDGGTIWLLHLFHNHDACNKPDSIVHSLIQRKYGLNLQCTMVTNGRSQSEPRSYDPVDLVSRSRCGDSKAINVSGRVARSRSSRRRRPPWRGRNPR